MPSKGQASRNMTQEMIALLIKMRKEGRTYREIGDRLRIAPSTVKMALKKHMEGWEKIEENRQKQRKFL